MCDKEHMLQWRSQPLVRGSGAGNILLAAGVLFSGCAVAATLRCLNSIGVQTITERTFYNYQRAYLLPAINELFHRKQAEMASELAGLQVDLAGDGRCDSPGYSAKYMTYSVLSMQNGCILHTEQVQVGESPEVPNSVSMEKQGLAKCLMGVEKLGIRIRSLTTDRHPGVNRYCRVEKPEIKHWFDTWHVAKGLKKKLLAASRTHQVITPWIQSILNHLYWVAAMGQGDGELVISMWRSLLNHVCNKHDGHDGPYKKCLHDSLDDREWLRPASPAFLRLKTIVDNARLLKDIRRLSPESNAFSVDGMQERTRLAVLHFNENAARHQALTQDGEQRWKIKSSKARRGHFTVTTVKEDPSYGQEVIDVFNTFQFTPAEQDDYDALVHRFNAYCEPQRNETFEKHALCTRMQHEGELFEQSSRNVQLEAQSCNFGEPKDFMVRDQLDCGTTDKKLRARLLHEKELTSDKAIDFCKAAEMH
ncbi:hypothetical protein HPB49_023236 [Dermacentor silvarum]|uniref:Uncharacterized protein n=1 Tax=Dermacentor silvarum TaxID=543639 RepID=A0ACB8CN78_DERSI|nr:hypothetical protein HPB49_023236 [Dermacentor silvarum]